MRYLILNRTTCRPSPTTDAPDVLRSGAAGLVGLLLAAARRSSAGRPVVASQADPSPGIELISAVYNSLQDRFFRPLDSSDLLDAAWEGARARSPSSGACPMSVDEPALTGDRAGDLGGVHDPVSGAARRRRPGRRRQPRGDGRRRRDDRRASASSTPYFLAPDQFSRYIALLTTDEGRVGLGIVDPGPVGAVQDRLGGRRRARRAGRRPGRRLNRGDRRPRRDAAPASRRLGAAARRRGPSRSR